MAIGARARVHTIRRTITVLSITFRGRQQRCPRERSLCHSLNATGVLAFCAFAVCSTVWGMGYRTHGLQNSRVFAGEKRDVHEPVSRTIRGTAVPADRCPRCVSHIPNF